MMHLPGTIDETFAALRHRLEHMARWGCRGFTCSPESLAILDRWSQPVATMRKEETLEQIRFALGDCRRCGLSGRRTHIVFGEGSRDADLVFVGEAPGLDDDESGRPFAGPAGELLSRIIAAMKLTREQVYICHVVKCRPPDDRTPEPEEMQACRPFLQQQIEVIRPKVICALGDFAAQTLLDSSQPLSRLRGRFHDLAGAKVMPTFHPSYLLSYPDQKREVWEDMKKIMAYLRIST